MLIKFKAIGWDENEKSYYFTYNPFDFDKNNIDKDCMVYSKVLRMRAKKMKTAAIGNIKKLI